VKESDERPLSLAKIVSEPGDTEGDDWYSWRLEGWGTKWDASFGEPFLAMGREESDPDATVAALGGQTAPGVAVYKFDTAWSPPILVAAARFRP
jgi:hypothetical protein